MTSSSEALKLLSPRFTGKAWAGSPSKRSIGTAEPPALSKTASPGLEHVEEELARLTFGD